MTDETTTRQRRITPDPQRPMLRTADLRARWGCSRQALYNWRRAGLIPQPVRIAPNTYAWPLAVIQEIERQRASA